MPEQYHLNIWELKENQIIKSIHFPNTVWDADKTHYIVWSSCDKIIVQKYNWENASILRFQVIMNNKVIAEIKQSICDVYYL